MKAIIPYYDDINEFLASTSLSDRTKDPLFYCLRLQKNDDNVIYKPPFRRGFYFVGLLTNAEKSKISYDNTNVNNLDSLIVAETLLDTATQKKELSEVYCVLSMINRSRVFINPMSFGSKYGPVATKYTQVALKTNPDNPRANYLEGWTKYSTPKLWGGDKKKARELLELAKQQLESAPPAGISPHWGKKEVDELLKELK